MQQRVKDFINDLAVILDKCSTDKNVEIHLLGDMNISLLNPQAQETKALLYFCNIFSLINHIAHSNDLHL